MAKERPHVDSTGQKELDKAEKQFEAFDQQVKELTIDHMNQAPKAIEESPKISSKELEKSNDLYLKPTRIISCKEKFNEKYRNEYNFAKEYVQFMAENKELSETIEMWTRPFPGLPAEYWQVPVNKPVWGPRYLAEQIKKCKYHRLVMDQRSMTGTDGMGQYFGTMVADTTIQRLDAHPVQSRKSVFMGASGF